MRRTPLGGLLACAALLMAAGGAWAGLRTLAIDTVDETGQRVAGAVCDVSFQGSNMAAGAARVISPATAQIDSTGDWVTVKCVKGLELAGAVTSIDTQRGAATTRAAGALMPSFRPGRDGAASVRVVLQDANATARATPVAKPAVAQLAVAQLFAPAPGPAADPVAPPAMQPQLPAERVIPLPTPAAQFVVAAVPDNAPIADAAPPQVPVSPKVAVASAPSTAPVPPVVAVASIPSTATAPPRAAPAAVDVFDVRAVPYLSEQGRAVYRDFLGYPTPRAFAISKGGSYGWAVRASDPAAMALANCERRGGPCELYAMDKQVVWAGAQ